MAHPETSGNNVISQVNHSFENAASVVEPIVPVSREAIVMGLGMLRIAAPHDLKEPISQETWNSVDEDGNMDLDKISPELIDLTTALIRYQNAVRTRESEDIGIRVLGKHTEPPIDFSDIRKREPQS